RGPLLVTAGVSEAGSQPLSQRTGFAARIHIIGPMEIAFLWVGLVFVAVGALIIYSELKAREGARRTPGRIAGFSVSTDPPGEMSLHAVIAFSVLDGRHRYLVSPIGSSFPLGRTGDAVGVLLRPTDPEGAALDSHLTWVLGAAIGLMGAACCAVFLLTF